MRNIRLEQSLRCEQREVADMIADIAASEIDSCVRSVEALAQVCRGVITGEGPTTSGRVHFSRTIDVEDTVLCARILVAAGRHGEPVSRAEVDTLFDIHTVADERRDGGRFDDLIAKAIVHHVMSASGLDVPGRELALARARPLDAWASGARIDGEARGWLKTRLREFSPASPAARTIARALLNERPPEDVTLAATFDIAA